MKTVFTSNSQTSHVFAQRTQNEGRSGNLFFEGNTIYSYGKHFPIATFHVNKNGTIVLFNANSYSNSTAKHQNYVARALSQYNVLRVSDPLPQLKELNKPSALYNHEKNIEYYTKEIENSAKKALTSRKYAEMHSHYHNQLVKEGNEYIKFFSIKTKQFKPCLNSKVIIEKVKAQKEETKRINTKRREEEKTKVSRWISGESVSNMPYETQYLRMKNGDTIETSKGVDFPLSHGILALKKIRACVEKKQSWHRNGEEIRLSTFHIDSIDENGNIIAGCHKVQYSEVERFAIANNL